MIRLSSYFGAFDVELDLPEYYILDGTGNLLNRGEVLPEQLMNKIALPVIDKYGF